jgi:hypothetical protein
LLQAQHQRFASADDVAFVIVIINTTAAFAVGPHIQITFTCNFFV